MPDENAPREVVRVHPDAVVLRAVAEGDSSTGIGVMFGHAARFDEWTEIDNWYEGRFLERIARGAFRKTIREAMDSIRCLFKHGWDPQIGDKVLGTIDVLREDAEGLYYEVALFDTSFCRDLLPGIQAEQYGASFRARVIKEAWDKAPKPTPDNPEGLPERTIKELSLANRDIGPCTFGAYAGATAAARSLGDIDPDLLARILAQHTDPRTRAGEEAAPVTEADGPDVEDTSDPERAADPQDTEPANGHSGQPPKRERFTLALASRGVILP